MNDVTISAVPFTRRTARELVDGTLAVTIHIEPMWRRSFMDLFPDIDMAGAMTPLTNEAAVQAHQDKCVPEKPPAPYGKEAQALWQAGFFYNKHVWKALGTDKEYLAWVIKLQPSCISGEYSEYHEDGSKYCIPCHVRRAGESGTAYQGEYAAVPMTNEEHKTQSEFGEAPCLHNHGILYQATVEAAMEWFDKKRMQYVSHWASERLKEVLGHDHLNEISPEEIRLWAEENNLTQYLPRLIKEYGQAYD